jgi:hypothetical protein
VEARKADLIEVERRTVVSRGGGGEGEKFVSWVGE